MKTGRNLFVFMHIMLIMSLVYLMNTWQINIGVPFKRRLKQNTKKGLSFFFCFFFCGGVFVNVYFTYFL